MAKAKNVKEKITPTIIFVDPHYIGTANRGDAYHCMVADAVREQLDIRDDVNVSVDGRSVRLEMGGKSIFNESLPEITGQRIADWDTGKNPTPFTVELNLPKDVKQKVQAR